MSSTQAKQVYSSSEEYEERVQAAKSDWLEGRFKSVCAAAHAHNDRINQQISRKLTDEECQLLSLSEKLMVVDWWEAEKQEKTEVQREKAEKEAQKATEDTAHEVRICVEVATRTFADPLASYKRKDDLIVLSGALGLRMTGTVAELAAQTSVGEVWFGSV
ncbi:hypothetical protein BC827DRAFT_1271720 [Russula dissimulans]|nr:hypothetical protein BC827DRAFT_1271720 [Russula dissimulans]